MTIAVAPPFSNRECWSVTVPGSMSGTLAGVQAAHAAGVHAPPSQIPAVMSRLSGAE